jgi:hypothetical protein
LNFTGTSVTATNTGGAVTVDITGGGGLTGFTAAESTAAPNATVYVDSLTSSAASTNADVAFVAKGTGATLAQVPDSTTAGGNKRGTHATDWQKSRTAATQVASGNFSSILGGQNNRASSQHSVVVGGLTNTANASYAFVGGGNANTNGGAYSTLGGGQSNSINQDYAMIAGGRNNTANGNGSFIAGVFNTTSGTYSSILGGQNNTANSTSSIILGGDYGTTRAIVGNSVCPASVSPIFATQGVQQSALLILGRQTTNATATTLTSNSSSANTTNQVILPNNSAYAFQGTCIANVTAGGTTSGWKFEGVIKRGANAASTALVAAVTPLVIAQDAGAVTWVLAVTADTTNGGIKVEVTGAAATTIRWVVKIETTEVTF